MAENEPVDGIPEQVTDAILDAELTPDERMVAEEDAKLAAAGEARLFAEEGPQEDALVEQQPGRSAMPDELVRRAKDLDFTDEEISGFEDPNHLSHWLGKMDQQLLKKFAGIEKNPVPQPDPQGDPQTNGQLHEPQEAESSLDMQYDEYMDDTIKSNFKAVEQKMAELLSFTQKELDSKNFANFEEKISRLGEDYHPLLGTSTSDRTDMNSAAFENANRLWAVQGQLREISPGMSDDDLFRRALSATFPDFQVEMNSRNSKADLSDRLRDAKGRFVTRPSKRGSVGDTPSEDSEAQDWINHWASERGIRMAESATIEDLFN